MKNKFCREIFSLSFFALLFLQLSAQQKALKIGDKIPEEIWTKPLEVVNSPQKTITLSEDRDKLILLDFWATWCSGCLLNFPKMQALEKQFGDQLKVVPVTKESLTILNKFFATKNGQRYKHLISVAEDKIFHQLFPHNGVPYIIWIKDGKVLNTTDAGQVTEKSITDILENQKSSLQTVIQLEKNRPLLLSEAFDREEGLYLQNYSLLAKGRIRSASFGTWFHRSGNKVYGRKFTNLSLLEIIKAITIEIFNQREETFDDKKVIIEAKNTAFLNYIENKEGTREDYNRYNYDYIVPLSQAHELYPMMLNNLNQFIDYTATIEEKRVKCLVLKKTNSKDQLSTKGGVQNYELTVKKTVLQNTPMLTFISGLSGLSFIPLPIINETGYKGNIDLKMKATPNLNLLNKELATYNLVLEEEERSVNMLIIRDK